MKNRRSLEEKAAQLKAALIKTEGLISERSRKERTGQLVAAGVLLEYVYKGGSMKGRAFYHQKAHQWLEGNPRTLDRALAMFARLDQAFPVTPETENAGNAGASVRDGEA